MENLKLLFQIYFRPAFAMSEILDRGSWLAAGIAVLIVSFAFAFTVNSKLNAIYSVPQFYEFYQPDRFSDDEWTPAMDAEFRNAEIAFKNAMDSRPKIPLLGDSFFRLFSFNSSFIAPLLSLSIFYIPALILLFSIFTGTGSRFGTILRRDYGALATCTLMAWTAAHLPFAILGILVFGSTILPEIYFSFWLLSGLLFGVFMIFALRTVLGVNYSIAVLIVSLAWLAISFGNFISQFVSPWAFSPFLLFFVILYFGGFLGGEVRGLGNSFRQRQDFKRFLQNATVNPKDADAHIQLGLIYLERRQDAKAKEHFERAFAIDNEEIDANYELGKLARKSGELQKALDHFATVVEQNDKHRLSEIWREIGATYLEADMLAEAADALEKFVERRPVDSEGLYYLGKTFKLQNKPEKAREMFEQAVEAARTSPDFRRGELRHWSKLAQKEL
ncbi:MAG: tetratricopeptide repeat protein [Pyrinomonadaceae bacterium]|nr:tetratricopeptide repeat protein [Pyrinomonadaceae bacterium]